MTPLSSSERRINGIRATLTIAYTASWYCSIIIVVLILFITLREENFNPYDDNDHHNYYSTSSNNLKAMKGSSFHEHHRPCDEIYVVGEGETLHTISDKCGDPYIVERNPHIHDPDDVFPGLVIKIMPSPSINTNRKLLS
ncbi:uncharacterized protein LOC110729501 [Chenopodium quinoa]|uniref:LysM domain-containing protein n=1 Tax=Chenopodium quinoa TaxID=63459 RepID=A0A803M0K2_CHEQI|nr:uncharacterized protein LOC110729501 [Chenopodium quinoa]